MAWQQPKIDWNTNPTNPVSNDFNRIEGNIDFLKTDIETKKGLIVDALNSVGIAALIADTHLQIASKILAYNLGAINHSLSINGSFTIPKGIHDGTGKVTQSIPTKGIVTITPGTANQVINAGQYLSGTQTIAGDADLVAGNIRSGANIFNVAGNVVPKNGTAYASHVLAGYSFTSNIYSALTSGTMVNRGNVAKTLTTQGSSYTVPVGYHSGAGKVTASFGNLVAGNVKSGVNVGDVVGNYAGAGIKKVFKHVIPRDTYTSTVNSQNIALSPAVSLANTLVYMQLEDTNNYQVLYKLTSTSNLFITSVTAGRRCEGVVFVVEFNPGVIKSKQTITLPNDIWDNYKAYTINAVNTEKTIIFGNGISASGAPCGYLTSSTTLMAMTTAFGSTTHVAQLQIIEFY